MSSFDKMRDKVAKLLRQAEDVVGTPEEAVFQAKAFELMAKYGIDQASIEAAKQGLDASKLRDAVKWSVVIDGKYASAQMLLLHNIATALHCETVYTKIGGGGLRFHVYGVEAHIERVKMLWELLQPQMMRLVGSIRPNYDTRTERRRFNWDTREYETSYSNGGGNVRSYRRSWIAGFGSAVGDRLREQETKALESDSSGALVLFQSDQEKAGVLMRMEHPRLKQGRSIRYNNAGYSHGRRDGNNASFNHSLSR